MDPENKDHGKEAVLTEFAAARQDFITQVLIVPIDRSEIPEQFPLFQSIVKQLYPDEKDLYKSCLRFVSEVAQKLRVGEDLTDIFLRLVFAEMISTSSNPNLDSAVLEPGKEEHQQFKKFVASLLIELNQYLESNVPENLSPGDEAILDAIGVQREVKSKIENFEDKDYIDQALKIIGTFETGKGEVGIELVNLEKTLPVFELDEQRGVIEYFEKLNEYLEIIEQAVKRLEKLAQDNPTAKNSLGPRLVQAQNAIREKIANTIVGKILAFALGQNLKVPDTGVAGSRAPYFNPEHPEDKEAIQQFLTDPEVFISIMSETPGNDFIVSKFGEERAQEWGGGTLLDNLSPGTRALMAKLIPAVKLWVIEGVRKRYEESLSLLGTGKEIPVTLGDVANINFAFAECKRLLDKKPFDVDSYELHQRVIFSIGRKARALKLLIKDQVELLKELEQRKAWFEDESMANELERMSKSLKIQLKANEDSLLKVTQVIQQTQLSIEDYENEMKAQLDHFRDSYGLLLRYVEEENPQEIPHEELVKYLVGGKPGAEQFLRGRCIGLLVELSYIIPGFPDLDKVNVAQLEDLLGKQLLKPMGLEDNVGNVKALVRMVLRVVFKGDIPKGIENKISEHHANLLASIGLNGPHSTHAAYKSSLSGLNLYAEEVGLIARTKQRFNNRAKREELRNAESGLAVNLVNDYRELQKQPEDKATPYLWLGLDPSGKYNLNSSQFDSVNAHYHERLEMLGVIRKRVESGELLVQVAPEELDIWETKLKTAIYELLMYQFDDLAVPAGLTDSERDDLVELLDTGKLLDPKADLATTYRVFDLIKKINDNTKPNGLKPELKQLIFELMPTLYDALDQEILKLIGNQKGGISSYFMQVPEARFDWLPGITEAETLMIKLKAAVKVVPISVIGINDLKDSLAKAIEVLSTNRHLTETKKYFETRAGYLAQWDGELNKLKLGWPQNPRVLDRYQKAEQIREDFEQSLLPVEKAIQTLETIEKELQQLELQINRNIERQRHEFAQAYKQVFARYANQVGAGTDFSKEEKDILDFWKTNYPGRNLREAAILFVMDSFIKRPDKQGVARSVSDFLIEKFAKGMPAGKERDQRLYRICNVIDRLLGNNDFELPFDASFLLEEIPINVQKVNNEKDTINLDLGKLTFDQPEEIKLELPTKKEVIEKWIVATAEYIDIDDFPPPMPDLL